MLTQEERNKCKALFEEGASRIKTWPLYWIHGGDESVDYCYECSRKKVAKLKKEDPTGEYFVDGGWGNETDDIVFCECGRLLDTSILSTGCEADIDHYLEYGISGSDIDCYIMNEVINSEGWEIWESQRFCTKQEREEKERYYQDLHKVCSQFLNGVKN